MSNKNAHLKGRKITTTQPKRFLAADFPGWGDDNYADFFEDLPAGQTGVIRSVESHGSFPYTRYSIELDTGQSTSGVHPDQITIH